MLVTFSCPEHRDVTFFGDVALQLLGMMGRSDTIPSALYAEDVRPALDTLQDAIAASPQTADPEQSPESEDDEPTVGIAQRALPLIELLETASVAQSAVMWDSNR